MTERARGRRGALFESFAASGLAPAVDGSETLQQLADQRVVVLDDDGRIQMAHPFAGHHDGARVDSNGRSWWGNCAWDA